MRDPTFQTGLLAIVLILAVALYRPPGRVTGVPPEQLWNQKLLWGPEFDLVLAGDSRTFQGLSPARMRDTVGCRRIANFGFAAAALTTSYLRASEALLDPASSRRALVLGVTPHSLTPNAARENELVSRWTQIRPWHPGLVERQWDNEFLSLAHQERLGVELSVWLGPLFHALRPLRLGELRSWWGGHRTGYFQSFHPDGWVESRQLPEGNPDAIAWSRRIFQGNRISPELTTATLDWVTAATRRGTTVYGFLFPVPAPVAAVEAAVSGWSEIRFEERFRQAGGVWLDFSSKAYASHDDCHLRADAALLLSTDLARAILHHEQQGGAR